MGEDRFSRVTEAQRECLRLVLIRRNSKEIAQVLNISPFTVDKRIARAVTALGVTSRFEAARLLAEHEGPLAQASQAYEPLAYQSPDIAAAAVPEQLDLSEALAVLSRGRGAGAPWLPLRPQGGRYNTLTIWQRLAWIGMIPAGLAVAVGMLGFALSVAGKIFQLITAVAS